MNKILALVLALAITFILALNVYLSSSEQTESKTERVAISRVIDGDTFETADGRTIRLLNINSPEKNVPSSKLAADYLKALENSSVEIKITSPDKYGRILARVYTPDYLNLYLVESGLASKFLVDKKEKSKFAEAEENAIKNGLGIWNHSSYFGCFDSKINPEEEIVTLKTKCGSINLSGWELKDESRKIYKFKIILNSKINLHSPKGEDNLTDLFWQSNSNIWNNDADSLYLFDSNGGIAHYEFYGY